MMDKMKLHLSTREQKFINNFIMSSENLPEYTNSVNWNADCSSYGFTELKGKFIKFYLYIKGYGYFEEKEPVEIDLR